MVRDRQMGRKRESEIAMENGTRIVIVWDETIDARSTAPLFASIRHLASPSHDSDELVIEVSTSRQQRSAPSRGRKSRRSSPFRGVAA